MALPADSLRPARPARRLALVTEKCPRELTLRGHGTEGVGLQRKRHPICRSKAEPLLQTVKEGI